MTLYQRSFHMSFFQFNKIIFNQNLIIFLKYDVVTEFSYVFFFFLIYLNNIYLAYISHYLTVQDVLKIEYLETIIKL